LTLRRAQTMPIRITKGLEIPLAGPPAPSLADVPGGGIITIYPREFDRIRHRLAVSEGDPIRRGGVLFRDKKNEAWRFCSPASGRIRSIVMGERRALDQDHYRDRADDWSNRFRDTRRSACSNSTVARCWNRCLTAACLP
jgi:Na+-transporting NADH:ubiquinone oxidoreductase subunit NqrA